MMRVFRIIWKIRKPQHVWLIMQYIESGFYLFCARVLYFILTTKWITKKEIDYALKNGGWR